MNSNIITGIFTISGIIIGAFLAGIINYLKERRDRKDRYFFALLDRRIEAYQQAYKNAEKLKSVIHGDDKERIKIVNQVKNWFNEHNLYLEPEVRKKFSDTIHDVSFYHIHLDDFRATARTEGSESEKTKEKKKELNNTFNEIMQGLQKNIQEEFNIYYEYLK